MKKLLVALLSLGLIVAFAMTASAQPSVKFSGQYYVVGVYDDNRGLADTGKYSRAVFWTRTRVQTDFQVAEGLKFTTRFDAFERQWGSVNRSSSTTEDKSNSGKISSTNVTLQENLEMEWAYVTFATRVGNVVVGYMDADEWGTGFGDIPGSRPRAKLVGKVGPLTYIVAYEKVYEADTTMYTTTPSGLTGADWDNYAAAVIYGWKGGEAGFLAKYVDAHGNAPAANFATQQYVAIPYMKATFGPVYVEGEVIYVFGKARKYDSGKGTDIDKDGLGAYVLARVNLGPAYVGGQFGYSSGQDPNKADKDTTGPISTTSWNPCLMFGNHNYTAYVYGNSIGGVGTPSYSSNKQNIVLYNIFGGFNVTPKLNLEAAVSMMEADKAPAGYVSKSYGTEVDFSATYKIYDNLTYMVGAGYLITGDFFKGTNSANKIGNDYMVMNKLTLNF